MHRIAFLWNTYFTFRDSVLSIKRKKVSFSEAIVMHLVCPYLDYGRNVTADNYLASLIVWTTSRVENNTGRNVAKQPRKNLHSCQVRAFVIPQKVILYTLSRKLNNLDLLGQKQLSNDLAVISTWIPTEYHKKADIVSFYNSTKSGADAAKVSYSWKENCRRWPYAFLDLHERGCLCLDLPNEKHRYLTNSHYTFHQELDYVMTISSR